MDLQLMCKPSKRKCLFTNQDFVKDDCSDYKKDSVCFTVVLLFLHCMLCTSLRIAANYSWFPKFVLLFLCIEHLYKDDMYCGTLHTYTGLKHVLTWHRVLTEKVSLTWHRVLTEKVSQKYTELRYCFMVALLKWFIYIANDM